MSLSVLYLLDFCSRKSASIAPKPQNDVDKSFSAAAHSTGCYIISFNKFVRIKAYTFIRSKEISKTIFRSIFSPFSWFYF